MPNIPTTIEALGLAIMLLSMFYGIWVSFTALPKLPSFEEFKQDPTKHINSLNEGIRKSNKGFRNSTLAFLIGFVVFLIGSFLK